MWCYTCDGFSLGETVCLGSYEFIIDYFGGMSLSPRSNDSGTALMGSTRSGPLSPRRAMIEDSTKEFVTASSSEGSSSLPSRMRHGARTLPAPSTSIPWLEDATAIYTMMTVPPWVMGPQSDTDHSFE
jgi:hypothetical protein